MLHLRFLGSLPFLTREPFRVMVAYWMITLIQRSSSMNPTMRAWKKRTSHFVGCTIMDFFQTLQRPFAVYCFISPSTRTFTFRGNVLSRKIFYIGSTLVSIQSQQDARRRKLRLLQKHQAVNCELALHYFHTRSSFHQFCILPVQF